MISLFKHKKCKGLMWYVGNFKLINNQQYDRGKIYLKRSGEHVKRKCGEDNGSKPRTRSSEPSPLLVEVLRGMGSAPSPD
jgi:hypothetical protein